MQEELAVSPEKLEQVQEIDELLLAVASLAPVAQAQSQSFAAKVNVPFTFETVSGQHFQPGMYTITLNGAQTR
jgi:hypothetical protein